MWAQRMLVDTSGLNFSRSLLDHLPFDLGVLGLGSPSGGLWAFWPKSLSTLSSTPMGPKMWPSPSRFSVVWGCILCCRECSYAGFPPRKASCSLYISTEHDSRNDCGSQAGFLLSMGNCLGLSEGRGSVGRVLGPRGWVKG